MLNSPVSDILSCYFDIKKNKLQWKGTLDDLKAFVLTEVDEETALALHGALLEAGRGILKANFLQSLG